MLVLLFAVHHGVVGPTDKPQPFTSAESASGAGTAGPSDTRSYRLYQFGAPAAVAQATNDAAAAATRAKPSAGRPQTNRDIWIPSLGSSCSVDQQYARSPAGGLRSAAPPTQPVGVRLLGLLGRDRRPEQGCPLVIGSVRRDPGELTRQYTMTSRSPVSRARTSASRARRSPSSSRGGRSDYRTGRRRRRRGTTPSRRCVRARGSSRSTRPRVRDCLPEIRARRATEQMRGARWTSIPTYPSSVRIGRPLWRPIRTRSGASTSDRWPSSAAAAASGARAKAMKKGIALRVDLDAAVVDEGLPQRAPVLRQRRRVTVDELVQQPG